MSAGGAELAENEIEVEAEQEEGAEEEEVADDAGVEVEEEEAAAAEELAADEPAAEDGAEAEAKPGQSDKAAPDADAALVDGANAGEFNVSSFDELHLDSRLVQAANETWRIFISMADSREAAGEAIYAALFEGAPSLQSLFTTPRAVQAMRFMNGLASFVTALDDPPKLKILVETLGFGHLHLDVTLPRVIIFRDAILDLFMVELAEKFTAQSREAWKKLLNYVGGALIYVKVNYADRINCLLHSWKTANHSGADGAEEQGDGTDGNVNEHHQQETQQTTAKAKKKGRFWGSSKKDEQNEAGGSAQTQHGNSETKESSGSMAMQNVPTTYPEMFLFNAAVMGFGTSAWMGEVLACFHNIVTNVANSARLQEECDILALRIAKVTSGNVNLPEYKSCMLASLRSLLPKDWDSLHEVSWTWLWENVERLILRVHGQPPIWEKALGRILNSMDEEQKFELRKEIYARFFALAPAGQDYFKQSNTYLHFIADKILAMTLELYTNPVKMVDDISALGLRHVGYGIPTELLSPFVTACVEVLMTKTSDETIVQSFRWSLGLISKMLVRTITEGSTIVMKAINNNSQKLLKKALSAAPRGERMAWMLIVQVGTQKISPLAWAIKSGILEAASAMIKDLLTFRADRDRYFYGVDDLFKRHPDLIKLLCDNAPGLLPVLLDGLIWRSRQAEAGHRRVNYYVKHLLVDDEGNFNQALEWMCGTKDPKLVCHPVAILVSDLVWTRAASRSFLLGKAWFFLTLIIFIMSQSVLQYVGDDSSTEGSEDDVVRSLIFAGRVFIYLCSMFPLLLEHIRNFIQAYRNKETIKLFKLIPIPKYLKEWQDAASLALTLCLVVILCREPILWCWPHQAGTLFEERCSEASSMRFSYTLFSMFAMFLYYLLLIDLTVISIRISAFALVCVRMLSEVCLFLGSLVFNILVFSSAISVLKHNSADYAGIHHGAYALFKQVTGTYSAFRFEQLHEEPAIFIGVILFMIGQILFLVNLLIAQLSCAYSAVYEDMVGYARLERAEIIVEIMPQVPPWRWAKFIDSLRLSQKVEFNPGDLGLAGGIQLREPASANPTTIDMIRRYGGSTSLEMQWPEDDNIDGDDDDRFDRVEKLLQKTLSRVQRTGGSGHRASTTGSAGGTGAGTLTGTGGSGSGGSAGSDAD